MDEYRLIEAFGAVDPAGWVRVLPIGLFKRFGRSVEVTADMVREMAANFGRVPETVVPVNAEHKAEDGKLADVVAVEARADGLWARLGNFIADAAQRIAEGRWQYLSPEIAWGPVDYDGQEVSNVLVGVGLTNLPHFGNATALYSARAVDADELAGEAGVENFAVWSTAYINDLPDASFLIVEGGGSKDAEGKTTPRSLRHFPYRDADGKVDLPHLRNALARIPQSNLPAAVKARALSRARRLARNAGIDVSENRLGGSDMLDGNETIEVPRTFFDKLTSLLFGKFAGDVGGEVEPEPEPEPAGPSVDELLARVEALEGEVKTEREAREVAEQKLADAQAEAEREARLETFKAAAALHEALPGELADMEDQEEAARRFERYKAIIAQAQAGGVELLTREVGGDSHGETPGENATGALQDKAHKLAKAEGIDIAEAYSRIVEAEPELYGLYRAQFDAPVR